MTNAYETTIKRCKVYPRNNLQFIPGILPEQRRIELPAELPLNLAEIKRCMAFANVYEMPDGMGTDKCVLLDWTNFDKDNSDAVAAEDVPDVALHYPLDEDGVSSEEASSDKKVENAS